MGIKHAFLSGISDGSDVTKVRPSKWNEDHIIDGDVDFGGFDITNCPTVIPALFNIAALQANTDVDVPLVYVQGYYRADDVAPDGGEGFFEYAVEDTTSADNGGTIIVDASGRRWCRILHNNVVSVKYFGAYGDGGSSGLDTDAIQAAFDFAFPVCVNNSPTPAQDPVTGNKEIFFPAGHYLVDSDFAGDEVALYLEGCFGGKITGAGKYDVKIENIGDGYLWFFNGCRNMVIQDLQLQTSSTEEVSCLEYYWSGTGTGNSPTLNICRNIEFGANSNNQDTIGCNIGAGGATNNSEHQFLACGFSGHLFGIQLNHFNVLNIDVVGCSIGDNVLGLYSRKGAFGILDNLSTAGNDVDILAENGQSMCVSNTRTESDNFISWRRGQLTVINCHQANDNSGNFVDSGGGALDKHVTLIGCSSNTGQIDLPRGSGTGGELTPPNMVINCQFGRDDWFSASSVIRFFGLEVGQIDGGGTTGTGTYNVIDEGTIGYDPVVELDSGIVWLNDYEYHDGIIIAGAGVQVLDVAGDDGLTIAVSALTADRTLTYYGDANQSYVLGTVAVASLPAAATAGTGARAVVNNATVTTFATNVVGGGANVVPVYSDGTNWKIG